MPRSLAWRWLRGVLTLFAASFLLALVIWFAITDSENEFVEQPFGFSLAVEAINVPSDLLASSRIPPVAITIAGREDDLQQVSVDDFVAHVDLAGFDVGSREVPIVVRSLNGDISVRAVAPSTVEVVLEPVVQRALPITVVIADSEPIGFARGEPVLSPETVTISGTANLIDLVDRVVAPVDLSGTTVDVDLPVTLQVRTNTGAAISNIRIEPPTVNVLIPIKQELFRRAVAIAPQLADFPAAGFRVAAITVVPLNVIVVGTLQGLERVGPAVTVPISLDGRDDDIVVTTPVIAPEGLTLEAETSVTITITIEPVRAQASFEVPLVVDGLAQELLANAESVVVQVVVQGPAPTLAELTSEDIRATIDAIGLATGVHRLTVQVGFIGGTEVVTVDPETVLVTLTEAPPPEESAEADSAADQGADETES
jgi:YbbR domain-containing protein